MIPLLLAVGLASDYLEAGINQINPWAAFLDYMNRGIPLVFWGLAAFAGAVALGTLFGRTVPAIIVALFVCLFVRGVWEPGINHTVLRPYSGMLASQSDVAMGVGMSDWQTDLTTYSLTYLDGKPWAGDQNVWWNEHTTQIVDANGNITMTGPEPGPDGRMPGPYSVPFGFHGNMYWPVVAAESGILFLGSLFCGAIALVWVQRRRPY
jgi:hypothetical protein